MDFETYTQELAELWRKFRITPYRKSHCHCTGSSINDGSWEETNEEVAGILDYFSCYMNYVFILVLGETNFLFRKGGIFHGISSLSLRKCSSSPAHF